MLRLFLAIEVSETLRANLEAMQTRLQAADADVRWSPAEKFHLTVAFLGDQPEGQLEEIAASVAPVAQATAPFRIGLSSGSAFPKRGPLKTLWVGVGEGAETWKSLAQASYSALMPVGIPPANELVPHITLGRVKSERNMDALRAALTAEAQTDCGAQAADSVVLIQSILNPDGATYREIRRFALAADNRLTF